MSEKQVQNENVVTAEGLAKLQEKLDELIARRHEISERIKQALAFGDISENSEYDEAKNDQAFNEGEIVRLENQLRTIQVVDEDKISTKEVHVGNKVTIEDMETHEKLTYTIVGSSEANPFKGTISNVSPVGSALLGKKRGQVVSVAIPAGVAKYKITSITK